MTDDDSYLREARFPALAACGGVFPARGQDRDLEAFTQGKPVFTTGNIGRGLNTALGGRVLGGGG